MLVPDDYQSYYFERYGIACYNPENESVKLLMESGEIAFTSFELLYPDDLMKLDQKYLKSAFDHRFAFVGNSNQPGCDLVIPVRYKSGDSVGYSAIIIQVKNYEEAMAPAKRFMAAGEKLLPSYCAPRGPIPRHYISVFLELNFGRDTRNVHQSTKNTAKVHYDNFGNHIMVIDQSSLFSILTEDVMNLLSKLAKEKVDYVRRDAQVNSLNDMDPHRFPTQFLRIPNLSPQ
jgi:hypothetical protein